MIPTPDVAKYVKPTPTDRATVDNTCPGCEVGTLSPTVKHLRLAEGDPAVTAPIHFSQCDSCGIELVDQPQSEVNRATLAKFKSIKL